MLQIELSEEDFEVAVTTVEQAIRRREKRVEQINEILAPQKIVKVGMITVTVDREEDQSWKAQYVEELERISVRLEKLRKLLEELNKTKI